MMNEISIDTIIVADSIVCLAVFKKKKKRY